MIRASVCIQSTGWLLHYLADNNGIADCKAYRQKSVSSGTKRPENDKAMLFMRYIRKAIANQELILAA